MYTLTYVFVDYVITLLGLTSVCCLGRATLHEWALLFHGTETAPASLPPHTPPYPINIPPPPRKNKNRKNKSGNTTSKPWRGSSKEAKLTGVFGKKFLATVSPPVRKTPRPSVISARRPTTTPPTKAPLEVTSIAGATPPVSLILMAPPIQPSNLPPPLFPAVYQKYPKIQQLFPYSRVYEAPPRPSKKGVSQDDSLESRKSSGKDVFHLACCIFVFKYEFSSSDTHICVDIFLTFQFYLKNIIAVILVS